VQRARRKPLSEQAYEQIREAIVVGELVPGERLRDQDLAAELGTSRTPVREALRRLTDEGLVVIQPNSATLVAEIDRDQAAEAYPVLAALYSLGARLGVPATTSEHDERLRSINQERRAALDRGDVLEAIALDDRFHGVPVEASANLELARAIERLLPKIHRLDVLHFDALAQEESEDDHEPIIAACAARDADLAAELVEASFLRLGIVGEASA
jgi:DNA-binding GntR family transcriptional regulator